MFQPTVPVEASPAERAPGKFGSLEFARGIAALLVVLDHAGYLVAEDRYFGRQAFDGLLLNFHVGVDFFFVLSGFIIATVHWGDAGRPDRLGRYARRRFTRIFPPYWIILTFVVITYALSPQLGVARQHAWPNVLASYALVPMPDQPVLGVAWTLVFEMAFYVLFGGLIVVGRSILWCAVPWAASILWAGVLGAHGYPVDFLTSPYHLEFMMGVLVAWAARSQVPRVPLGMVLLAGTGGLAFAACALVMTPASILETPLVGRLVFGGAAAAVILGIARLEMKGVLRVPAGLQLLGTMSYSLYLSHVVTESLFMRFAMKLPASIRSPEVVAILVSLAAVAGGWAFWRLVERPLLRRLNGHRPTIVPVSPSLSS